MLFTGTENCAETVRKTQARPEEEDARASYALGEWTRLNRGAAAGDWCQGLIN